MSNQLQQNRYDQLIRRAGGLIGGGSKVSSVIPELFPVLELERTTPELLALSGWRTAWQSTSRLSGAGNRSVSQLFNPADSGQLVAITQLLVRVSVGGAIQAETVETQIGTGVSGLYRDTRFGVPRSTVAEASSTDGGIVGGGLRFFILNDTILTIRDDNGIVILAPGTGLSIAPVTNQLTLEVNYFWRERVAEASELSFP